MDDQRSPEGTHAQQGLELVAVIVKEKGSEGFMERLREVTEGLP